MKGSPGMVKAAVSASRVTPIVLYDCYRSPETASPSTGLHQLSITTQKPDPRKTRGTFP